MSLRSTHLQLRIAPEQKAALKRLADAEGLSLSEYVLRKALPPGVDELSSAADAVQLGRPGSLAALRLLLGTYPTSDLQSLTAPLAKAPFHARARNHVAAIVEEVALAAGADPPPWTAEVEPLPTPHFRWHATSLRPYQLKGSPTSLKRRNIFEPPSTANPAPLYPFPPRESASRLAKLGVRLLVLELDVSFYYVGGAILAQAYHAHPGTAKPQRLWVDDGPVLTVATQLARTEGWHRGWLEEAVEDTVRTKHGHTGYLSAPGVEALAPPPAYALAMKLASAEASPPDAQKDHDLRFLLRSLNLKTATAAIAAVAPYMAKRNLPASTPSRLASLLT